MLSRSTFPKEKVELSVGNASSDEVSSKPAVVRLRVLDTAGTGGKMT
jgi:hypothetical protein